MYHPGESGVSVGVGVAVGANVAATGVNVGVASGVGLAVSEGTAVPSGIGVTVQVASVGDGVANVAIVVIVAVGRSPMVVRVTVARRVVVGDGIIVRVGLGKSAVDLVVDEGVQDADGLASVSAGRSTVSEGVVAQSTRVGVTPARSDRE